MRELEQPKRRRQQRVGRYSVKPLRLLTRVRVQRCPCGAYANSTGLCPVHAAQRDGLERTWSGGKQALPQAGQGG